MTKARDLANSAAAFSAVSATELGYVDGVTSAIQTQLDAKIAKTLTSTTGDIIYASAANTPARLGIGSSAQILTVASGIPSWATAAAGGTVIKVVYGSTTTSTNISSTSFTDTTLTASITPTSNTSKVLVLCALQSTLTQSTTQSLGQKAQLVRGATNIFTQPGAYQSGYLNLYSSANGFEAGWPLVLNYLDSPATTSSTTYKLQIALNGTANSATSICQHGSAISTIILMEIGA